MPILTRPAASLCGIFLTCATVLAADWPQWRGPNRDGRSAETGILSDWTQHKPQLEWMVEGMGRGYASLAIADGRLYTTGNFENGQGVVAADARTGRILWRQPITRGTPQHSYEGSRSTPTVDGDRLYVVTSDGRISCLKTDDGSIVWTKDFRQWGGRMMSGWGFSESPLIDGDRVICTPGGDKAMLVALNKRTGDEIWRAAVPAFGDGKPGAAYSSAVISQGGGVRQYVQLIGRGAVGIRAEDGKFLWSYDRIANGTANIPTPLVQGDYVFVSTGYQTGAALLQLARKADGVEAREVYFLGPDKFQNHHGQMVLVDGYIYAGHQHRNGLPICVELKSGRIAWGGNIRGEGKGSAAVIYADRRLIFRYEDGTIALIEATPEQYRLRGTLQPEYQEDKSWSHPVVANGRLYLREQDRLMCYRLTDAAN